VPNNYGLALTLMGRIRIFPGKHTLLPTYLTIGIFPTTPVAIAQETIKTNERGLWQQSTEFIWLEFE
jgi:hypothetical protein